MPSEGAGLALSLTRSANRCALRIGFLFALFLFSREVRASSGTESAAFLDIPVGAGPAALGGAYTALATDLYAPVWNPAGLGSLGSTQVGGQHLAYLESIHYEHLGFVLPLRSNGGIGVSAQYLGTGDIQGRSIEGAEQPDYSSHYGAYALAYGHQLNDKFSLGLTGKFIEAKISDVSSTAFAADIGSMYRVNPRVSLAATLTNMGSKLKFLNDSSSLPLAFHLAGAAGLGRHWLASVEGVFPKTGVAGAHVGLQWQPLEMVALRAGYKTETTKQLGAMAGLTVGAGLKIWGQELAYAWVPYGDLGDTQYFSLVMRFGENERAKRNLIQVQDIKRHGTGGKQADDSEAQQLMELLKNDPDRNALAPKVGTKP